MLISSPGNETLGTAFILGLLIGISAVIVLLGGDAEMVHQTARDTTEGGSMPLGSRGAMVADHVGEAQ